MRKKMDLQALNKRRSFLILLIISLLFGGLLVRLWWIQVAAAHSFSPHNIDLVKAAVRQRQQAITLNSGRGEITDRHGEPLTGVEKNALIIFPLARGNTEVNEKIRKVAEIVQSRESEIMKMIQKGKNPAPLRDFAGNIIELNEKQMKQINDLKIPGILSVAMTERYAPTGIAKQVIGYVSQNPERIAQLYADDLRNGKMMADTPIGSSGLERTFDRFLQGMQPSILSYYVDGQGNPLSGLDTRFSIEDNAFYPLTVKTTVDHQIQSYMEQAMDMAGIEDGAVVVLDVKNSDILAMASRPKFDPTKVNVEEGKWKNQALIQISPGSVYKTVVAAAALEDGGVSPRETFTCEGSYGKYGFSCWKKEGHGHLTMLEAFAESCNITFAEIAKRLGGERILKQAEKMGLTNQVGWQVDQLYKMENFKQLDGEEKGQVFAKGVSPNDEGVLIQTAIGQRDVQVSPLQTANMMAMIARGGKAKEARLVSEIEYRNGSRFYEFPENELAGVGVDKVTSQKLSRFLQEVVREGTGSSLKDLPLSVAGKSGTAQVLYKGEPKVHQWFAGFAPANSPRYAIVVVAKNQQISAASKATQAFKLAIERLATFELRS
ncbi:penicillin-binding protein 2 [Brevibacillus laterosporus]|uniref:Penicillin-binding protein 2 n=2 Tax=Brevibacillus laterosporus TaxID=1465 RepID=A0AAP3G673_BRELA|nr:penicillin-binding protein 2 [Brevibacillus laterosporus]MCZ0806013.1 penicillin-binding protein 2 [Brevibacillus laterosporus]MCZ0824240.1 penicillin-binding protein 2 [Brevibacillus laterosporus]MCZ0848147.1 penicillin-binding protein 2 [Brevibacillus laterosporus]